MGEIIGAAYLVGFAGTAGWASQHTDFVAALVVAALWPIFWPARIIRRMTND